VLFRPAKSELIGFSLVPLMNATKSVDPSRDSMSTLAVKVE